MYPPRPPSSARSHRTRRPSYKLLESTDPAHGTWSHLTRRQRSGKAGRVEVIVPTLRQINARLETARRIAVREQDSQEQSPPALQIKSEEEDAKVYFLLQARIKTEVKAEEILPEDLVRHRLALIGYNTLDINVPPDILGATTTRRITTNIWGGSMRSTFPNIGSEYTHGLDDFMYISLQSNPHVPRWPGSPGLVFMHRDDIREWPKVMRLIVCLRPRVWQYMGQYKMTRAPPLTPGEWNAQPYKFKKTWAKVYSLKRLDGNIKVKLVLRKRLGRDPTPQEVANALKSKEPFHASGQEILQACEEGQLVIPAWYMKCVGYDVDFQQTIAARS